LAPGIKAIKLTSWNKPCRLYLVKIKPSEAGLGFHIQQGRTGLGDCATLEELSDALASRVGEEAVVGINGDLFNNKWDLRTRGNPEGLCLVDGELISTGWQQPVGDYDCLCTFTDNVPAFVRLKFSGCVTCAGRQMPLDAFNAAPFSEQDGQKPSRLVLYDNRWPAPLPADGVLLGFDSERRGPAAVLGPASKGLRLKPNQAALVGFGSKRAEVRGLEGTANVSYEVTDENGRTPREAVRVWNRPLVRGCFRPTPREYRKDYPRSMIGLGPDLCVLLVADGRKPLYSESVIAADAAEILRREGCSDVGQMDGGGSATLWAMGEYLNNPSDLRPRRIGNGIFFTRLRPPFTRLAGDRR